MTDRSRNSEDRAKPPVRDSGPGEGARGNREVSPAAERPVRDSGPGERARGNREVPPPKPDSAQDASASEAEEVVEQDDLQAQLAAAERRADEHLDDLRRLAAEFDNYRKRVVREQERLVEYAHEGLVKELLPVLDDLERALEAAEYHEEAAAKRPVRESGPVEGARGNREVPPTDASERLEKVVAGVKLVHRALADVLRKEGLEEIDADGGFDPHVHEALLSQPSEAEEGTVIQVLQRGWRLGDRVLRPARVVVSAGPPPEAA